MAGDDAAVLDGVEVAVVFEDDAPDGAVLGCRYIRRDQPPPP